MYLITKDYERIIQTNELNAITSSDVSIRRLVEGSTEEEMKESLIQRFDLDSEFTSTDQFSMSIIYKGNNRVYLDASAYNSAIQYLAVNNTLVLNSGLVYKIALDTPSPAGAFDPTKWTLLGSQYDLFFITLPFPMFDQNEAIKRNDKRFWKDKVYTSKSDSTNNTQQGNLQGNIVDQNNYIINNPLPDDTINGPAFWGTGVAYSVPAGTLPTNTTYWTKGDNRNRSFVEMYLDIVVYKLSKRIAPNNIPEARHNAWLYSTKKLKEYADGKRNANLPLIQPKQGTRIRYGTKPKRNNDW